MAAIRLEDFMVASYDITDREPARKLCMRRKTGGKSIDNIYNLFTLVYNIPLYREW